MNKIFKVVWSKTKECYVVVSEVAKNNGGKKKVLASVLAGLAMAGIGASGTPVLASYDDSGSKINIAPNAKTGNYVGTNSVVVGYENATDAAAGNLGRIIYGTANIAAGDSTLALGNSNEARGTAVVAVGHGSAAKAKQSVAIGNVARAEKDGTVAIGTYVNAETANVGTADKPKYNTKETGVYSTAVGAFSWSKGDYSAAYGYQAEATGTNAVAIGRVSKATGTSATALGVNNKAQADDSSAVGSSNTIAATATQASAFGRENQINLAGSLAAGYKNTTNGERNVAVGSENTTTGEDSIGIGTKVIAGTGKTIAIGSVATNDGTTLQTIARGNDTINKATGQVNNIFALAIGNGAQADGKAKSASGMIAIGQEVKADNNNTIAVGVKTQATGNNSTAIGGYAQAIGVSSAAFGTQAVANGLGATAFGPGASAGTGDADGEAEGAVAIGRKASVAKAASGAAAIGWASEATKADATAIGHSATANIAGGVALGSESKTTVAAGVQGYNPASDRTDKYSTQAGAVGTSTLAAVSIGDGSAKTRQLTGLAAGTADTDAVNVAQLKNVNLKYAGDTGNSDVLLKDHTLNVKGSDFITTSADGTGITVKAKIGNPITANTAGKAEAPATNGLATTTNVADAINASGWNVVSSNNGGSVTGTQATKLVNPGSKVTLSAGKNIVLDQNDKQFTYSLNKDVDLTKDGSLTIGDTKITNAGMTITGGPSITKTGIDAGSKKITNVTAGTADTDAVNVKQLKDTEKHIKPGTYAVANDGSVTLKYVDGNGAEQTETAKITGIAKKSKVINGQNTTVEEGTDTTDNSVTYKVNVKGDLADISSITNGTGSGKISFEGDQVVKVGGDHPISFDGKGGYVTGLENKTWDLKNPTVVSGRAATEDQLKAVSDGFNNTVKLTGNTGATGTQKLNQDNGLSFGVVGADNGKYIKTTASGSNVVADLSDDAKAKLEHKVVVEAGSKNVTVATDTTDPSKTVYKVSVANTPAGAASTESVVKKAVTGDTNIADITVAGGKATGDADAQYEVNVSRNDVKDAAREAVTVNNGGTTKADGSYTADSNNPISVTPTKDDTNHNTSYAVTFDGNKAAKQIPLTYKANGNGAKTVTLEKGLDFTNGTNTTAEIGNDGVVKYNLNKDVDLSNTGSLKVGGTTVNNGGITIKAPTTPGTTTTDVKLTNTGLNNGGNTITNVAEGQNNTDAVNVKQLKANRTEVKAGDNVVVTSAADATDNHTIYTVNAVTPAVYTTPDGEKLTKDKDGKFHKVGETAEYTGDIITSFENPKAAAGQTTKDGGMIVNNVGSAIKNQTGADYLAKLDTANGATPNAAVNVSDLKNTADALKSNELHIRPTASNRTGETVNKNTAGTADEVYKYDAATKSVTLKYNDGTGAGVTGTEAKIDLSDLANQITSGYTFSANATANGGKVANETTTPAVATAVANGGTINYAAGKNLTVKQEIDATNKTHTYTYSLDKDLTNLDKVVVNGKDGIAGKDGVTIVGPQGATGAPGIPGTNGIDGKVGISGKDGKDAVSIAGKDGVGTIGLTGPQGPAGTNGKSVDISTENGKQTLVKPEANNGNQSQRIVYVPKDKDGNPLLDKDNNPIKREVATMDDGLKFAGDDGQTDANKVIAKQLNEKVDIIGGATGTLTDNNIGVNNDGGKLKVQLAKDVDLTNAGSLTVGGTKVNNDGITIKAPTPAAGTTPTTTDVKLTNTGLDNGGNKITNVAEGTNNTDAVNVKQLKENRTEVKAGDNVVVTSTVDATDNHTVYTVNAVTPAVYTTPDGEKLTKDKDGKFHKVGETAEYTGDIITSFENPKAAAGQTTKDGGMIVNNVGSAIKNQTPTMPAGQTATYLDKLKAAADAGSNVKNAAVNVSDLHNTAEALKASELHIAPTAGGKDADKGGVASGNTNSGAAAQAYKYNATTKQVELTFNDGNGKAVTGPKAVIDLSDLANQITSGYTFSANATANGGKVANETTTPAVATAVANGGTINYAAGKNLTVKQEIDATNKTHTYTYSLDKDLTNLDKVVVNGKDGIAGKDGVTIVGPQGATGAPGIPGTNGIDGKVGISGKDGKDAVSIAGKDGVGTIGLTGPQGPAGTNGKSVDISTENGKQTLVKPEKNNGDQSQRIVYVPKDKDGNPLVDKDNNPIKREVATMDDGLKFAGDDGQTDANKVIAKQLNEKVDIIGGATGTLTDNNIGVNNDGGKLKVQLAKDVDLTNAGSLTVGGTKVNNDGITIKAPTPAAGTTPTTTDVKLTNTGLDNGGNKITNVAEGTNNTDAVNVKQLKENRTEVKAGDNVVVTSTVDATDNHTVYTVNAVTPAVYTTPDGEKLTKDKDGKFHKVGETAEYTGDIITSFENPKAAAGQTTKDGGMIVNNVGSAIKNQTPTMPAGQTATYLDKLKAAADAGSNVKNAAVNVSDLHNTAEALKASELHIAPTAGGKDADKGGVVKTAGSTDMVYKYDAASKTITLTYNDGNGKAVTGPKAVLDFTDLNIPAGGNNFGFKANATANGGTVANDATTPAAATAVENGGTVNFAAGKNLTVKQDIDATNKTQTYTFSLDKDLTNLDKVVVNGKDGIAGKDGVTIVGPQGATGAPGIPGTNGIDGKVGISGKDGKDAVSIAGKDGVGTIGLTGPQGPAGTNGKSVDISTENGKQTLVKPEANNGNQSQRIVYVPKDANGNPLKDADGNDIKREVATMDDGLRFTGNNTSKENKQPMNSLVKVQGEGVTENAAGKLEANGQEFKSAAGNIAVEADGQNTLTVKMNKDLNLTKDGSVTMGDTVVNNDGITIKAPTTPGTTTTDVKLTNQGLDNGGNKITNVAAGTANTDAVNVKQLKDNVTTVTSSDSSIKVVDKNDPTSATYDATKGHQYDITVNNQGVVNNAQTPVVYTKEDGTKVYKQPNGTFTTNIDGTGTVVPANQVIASMNSAGNSSTDPTKLQNVGSSIADKTGTTFLDKINTAAADPNAKYGAVNVTDLKSTSDALIDKGLVFDANNGDPKTNKLGSKVTIAGTGALGTGENFADKYNTDNIRTNIKQDAAGNTTVEIGLNKNLKGLESVSVPGKDGVDGQDGVSITGKDGANGLDGKVSIGKDGKDAVSISGKDGIGHIGLTGPAGKDGKNATADITVKEGQPGLNGTDGITRIVYKDKDGNDHEVATHDDGVKYAGDDAQGTDKTKVISKKLNQTIDIVGGADKTKLTDNNIGVNNDGGKLKVQLANELAGINKISNGGSSITFNSNPGGATNTPAVQISGGDLNMGGNKITNLKKGTAASDAATVGQLTKVKSSNNSVGITESTDANGAKVYDLSVTGVPGADPRVDKLGEEIGRVGAQGAALAALKPIQYDPLEPTQIMAGYGNYRGNSAVALGVAHYKNESTLIHGGVSWAGGSSHMMANAGVTWKVGNRDSEAAVADRYRKGPISSTYAMQQEMAAMKAQNAGLKGEVSDLKAENEQMKAQIAAMMAKLGL
ncbi:ESPR-type extended signal peptide-containing protein [Veillonella tobetsuensis]|uniref:ESPR-type extended signal peptide-containing protein n=1 Tax=Veillonella tobetsuensis TaxID=1110546 RepID=UPI00248E86B0|nr:ESPR-type extended signal peptide-containing protein [Veillonella tobetsuensis]